MLFFDRTVQLADGKLTSTTGELAGSVLDMATAVRNTVNHVNLPLAQALNMAAKNPADYLKQSHLRGMLMVNSQADFVELNEQQQVLSTWINGKQVYPIINNNI